MCSLPVEETRNFPSLPPFPKDVPTAPLLRVCLANLLSGDVEEEQKLYQACKDLGFFYLDLRPPNTGAPTTSSHEDGHGATLLSTSDALFELGKKVFELPVEEKVKYDLSAEGSYFGYKGLGAGVIDAKGTKDRNEFYNVSKDDILGHSPKLPNPPVLQDATNREVIGTFMESSHAIVTLILGILNAQLGLPSGVLEGLHRLEAESGDQVRWVKSPPQRRDERSVALGEHTDFGSVTVLFNRLGGLQVLMPGEGETGGWKYVKPLEGCCVVNLGDAVVKFTGGVCRSNVRFLPFPLGFLLGNIFVLT